MACINRLRKNYNRSLQKTVDSKTFFRSLVTLRRGEPLVTRSRHPDSPSEVGRGSVNKNMDPLPNSLSTQILPPSVPTMLFAMDNPNPVP
jgi:hypothetical protein